METVHPLLDAAVGGWVNERLLTHDSGGVRVGSVVPTGFPRVIRVLHPAGERAWADIAVENRKTMHPLVQWGSISASFDGSGRDEDDPEEGSAPEAILGAIFQHCPADGQVVYGVWDGFGSWTKPADRSHLLPGWGGRAYRLFVAEKTVLTRWPGMDPFWEQSPNLIWPFERTWCVATEIDWDSTLVACASPVAERLLADQRLESFSMSYDDDLSWYGDTMNPRPDWLRRS